MSTLAYAYESGYKDGLRAAGRTTNDGALYAACKELVSYVGTCPFDAKDIDTANWSEQCDRECSTDVDMAACWMRYFLEGNA